MSEHLTDNKHPFIFYDGDCGLCNRSVQFVLKHERNSDIRFSALQSEFAQHFFTEKQFSIPDLTTFYFYENGKLNSKSSAAFKVIPYLKWYWQPLRIFSILPRFITNFVYDIVAKYRKQIGGTFCALPSEENRKRFLS